MAVIKSGASTDELDIDPTSKAARVTLYDTSGNPITFGSGGTSAVDEAAFTAGATQGTPAMGAYQTSPAALTNGQLGVLSLDSSRRLIVNVGAGSTGNAAASATGAAVPASADYGGVNVGGTLRGATGVNPSGTVYAQQSDVASIAGTTTDVNSGVKGNGTQRIVIATDQPQLTNALKVDGSAVTQPVSAASLPLPSGASTAAKQPALGTAGTASADVITIQGIASMTAVKVDGSGSTQPVSGTVTVTQGTAADLNATVVGTGTFAVQEATLDAALIAQEATTSGVKGLTAFGAVTTAAPTYTTAKSDALSLQTNGSLRTAITDALPAGSNVIGHMVTDSGSTTAVTQATAASLNATVVGTGTFATQAAITAAIGSIASGALASGSIAAGAIAAGATSIADNEDVASADGDRGVKMLVTRKGMPANTSGTDGDYEFLQVSNGRLWTQGTNVRIYAASVTLTTTNFTSLANGSGWQSASITTSGNDVHFLLTTKTSGTAYVDVYVAEELTDGSTWTDGATGSEGTFTAANRLNSRYLGSIRLNNASASAAFKASDIYGVIPGKIALIVINNAGAAISSTAGDTVFGYQVVA